MNGALPLLVFDTNIMMDVWLGRENDQAILLVQLAENQQVELVIPEYVLFEFRGTALRWLRRERTRLNDDVRRAAKEWVRSNKLDAGATAIQAGAKQIEDALDKLEKAVDEVSERIKSAASRVDKHTPEIHFQGDLRFLSGRPPDRPVDGIKDCRIYEAILALARSEKTEHRLRYVLTKDADFDYPELVSELRNFGFELRKDPGKLYGELLLSRA